MSVINVEGTTWGKEQVLYSGSEDAFIKQHINDEGTYCGFSNEKKFATLKLIWQLSSSNIVATSDSEIEEGEEEKEDGEQGKEKEDLEF